jgi:hypothetical protein
MMVIEYEGTSTAGAAHADAPIGLGKGLWVVGAHTDVPDVAPTVVEGALLGWAMDQEKWLAIVVARRGCRLGVRSPEEVGATAITIDFPAVGLR